MAIAPQVSIEDRKELVWVKDPANPGRRIQDWRPISPDLQATHEGWLLRVYEQHGQVRTKGRNQFHYMSTAIATKEGERRAFTMLGQAHQAMKAMLQTLGLEEIQADSLASHVQGQKVMAERAAQIAEREAEQAANEEALAKHNPKLAERRKKERAAHAQRDAEAAAIREWRPTPEEIAEYTWLRDRQPQVNVTVAEMKRFEAANSAQQIAEKGTIKRPIPYKAALYAISGTGPKIANGWELIPEKLYKGRAMSYHMHGRLPNDHPLRYGYEGIRVKYKQEVYCMSRPVVFSIAQEKEQEETAKAA